MKISSIHFSYKNILHIYPQLWKNMTILWSKIFYAAQYIILPVVKVIYCPAVCHHQEQSWIQFPAAEKIGLTFSHLNTTHNTPALFLMTITDWRLHYILYMCRILTNGPPPHYTNIPTWYEDWLNWLGDFVEVYHVVLLLPKNCLVFF